MLRLSDDLDDFKRLYEKRFEPSDVQWTFSLNSAKVERANHTAVTLLDRVNQASPAWQLSTRQSVPLMHQGVRLPPID